MIPPLSDDVVTWKCCKCGCTSGALLMHVVTRPLTCGICNQKQWVTGGQLVNDKRI